MRKVKLIIVILILALVVVFAVQNQAYFEKKDILKLDLLVANYTTPELSNAVICVIAFLLGIIVAYLGTMSGRMKQRKSIKQLNTSLSDQQNEIVSLKSELDAQQKAPPLTPTEVKPSTDGKQNSEPAA